MTFQVEMGNMRLSQGLLSTVGACPSLPHPPSMVLGHRVGGGPTPTHPLCDPDLH